MRVEPILVAIANRHRLRIINTISNANNRGIIVGAASKLLGLSQPTVSHHLQKMREANVLDMVSNSYCHVHTINVDTLKFLIGYLQNVIDKCERKKDETI